MATAGQEHVAVRKRSKVKSKDVHGDELIQSVSDRVAEDDEETKKNNNKEEIEKIKQEVHDMKNHMFRLQRELLPRERKLCLKKEEVALDISKSFSDLRHQMNQLLLQEEQKFQNELHDIVEKETNSFHVETKSCKTLMRDLDSKEDLLKSLGTCEDLSDRSEMLFKMKNQLKDHHKAARKLDEISANQLELNFKMNTGLLDTIKEYNFGSVDCGQSMPIDVFYEEANLPEEDGDENDVGDNTVDDDVSTSESCSFQTENTDDQTDLYSSPCESESDLTENVNAEASVSNSNQEESVRRNDTRSRQNSDYSDIPDDPPPPYPGLPENFFSQQMSTYTHHFGGVGNTRPSSSPSCGAPIRSSNRPASSAPRSSSRQFPSAPPDNLSPDYRGRRSQEYLPVSPSYQNEEDNQLFNMVVISRVNSASFGFDKRKPGIAGMCWIDASFLMIADRWNCCVKLVHQSGGPYRILSFQTLEPWDMTRVETNEVAVTLPKAKKIYTIHYSNGAMAIKSSKTITTVKGYSSIAFSRSTSLYIGAVCPVFGNPCVDIFDMRGMIQATFETDRYYHNLFQYPRSIEVVAEGLIAVSDYKKTCVTFIRMDGEVVDTYNGTLNGPRLKDPHGITSYNDQNVVFVVDSQQNTIHTITTTGEFKGVLKDRENMSDPKRISLWKDSRPLKLAVALGSGYIATFRLDELHEYV